MQYDVIKKQLDSIWQNIKILQAKDLSIKLVGLSALTGLISEKVINAEQIFMQTELNIWREDEEMSSKKVEILSKITPEYKEYQLWKTLGISTIEVIRALKFRLKVIEKEGKDL